MKKKKRRYHRSKVSTTPFIRKSLARLNREIEEMYSKVTGEDKVWNTYEKIKLVDAEECFHEQRGRCAFCTKRMTYLGVTSRDAARLMFYVPLKVGGEARPDNLICVCADCEHDYRDTKKLRQDITDLDTFADVIERLVKAVWAGEGPEITIPLKNRLNERLADVAACMRYVTTDDWKPDKFVKVIDEENTIGEQVEDLIKGEGSKEDITQTVKQIVTTKQYKIIRKVSDG